jgi:hypothetical protein
MFFSFIVSRGRKAFQENIRKKKSNQFPKYLQKEGSEIK